MCVFLKVQAQDQKASKMRVQSIQVPCFELLKYIVSHSYFGGSKYFGYGVWFQKTKATLRSPGES